jgi:voltage-gated potassium channel
MQLTKKRLAHIVFEHDDKESKRFDLLLLILILISVTLAILDSIPEINASYAKTLRILEWVFTGAFTIEYLIRIWLSSKKAGYIFSFYGIIDLLAILPSFLSLVVANTQLLVVIRALRFLRVLRILKVGRFLKESESLTRAIKASRIKIGVFLGLVVTIVLIMGTVMFIVEGPENGFTSIPRSMYWAIVTLTTVGFGDITPQTNFGQFLASVIMLLGYGIIAIPTGIVTSEITMQSKNTSQRLPICSSCNNVSLDPKAKFCSNCGNSFEIDI